MPSSLRNTALQYFHILRCGLVLLFLGQAVACAGTAMTNTLKNVDRAKLLEMPVTEDLQMGMSIGMALNGMVPISIYPRWNFLLCAVSQVVSHLDKLSAMSDGGYQPKVIIRTGIGKSKSTKSPACHGRRISK